MQSFWPGPLTLIVAKSDLIPDEVSAGLDTVGVRMPSHPIAARLIKETGRPIAAPSANISGKPSPTDASAVWDDMQGKIAGVQVTTVDGAPGADINIRVRGGTSVTQSNDPLYIVDGFQVDNINDIPPTDIASIDVLKDASITAIYGAKGGNGVVVVTTKSAKAGKIQVSFNAHLSTSHLSKKLDLMNSAEFARYQYEWSACNGSRSSNAKFFPC